MVFPELDQYGTPISKLPNCPVCDEDELGVIYDDLMICYNCGYKCIWLSSGMVIEFNLHRQR